MALEEIYVDHTGGSDSLGNGSVEFPYQTLSQAFSSHSNVGGSSDGMRFNVKNTTYASGMTSLGTLPTGTTIGKQLWIQSYSSTAGDSTDYVYLDADGSDDIWVNTSLDAVAFVRCYFYNTATSGHGRFYDLDNQITCYETVFDGCRPQADTTLGYFGCIFKNMTPNTSAGKLITGTSNRFISCLISGSGSDDTIGIEGICFQNCAFYWDGSLGGMCLLPASGGQVVNNSFVYSSGTTHSSHNGIGCRMDDFGTCFGNYFENCKTSIGKENNADSPIILNNAHFNCTTHVASGIETIYAPDTVTQHTMSASGHPNAPSNWTPSTALYELRDNALPTAVSTPSNAPHYYGAFLSPNTGSGGGYVHRPQIRTL